MIDYKQHTKDLVYALNKSGFVVLTDGVMEKSLYAFELEDYFTLKMRERVIVANWQIHLAAKVKPVLSALCTKSIPSEGFCDGLTGFQLACDYAKSITSNPKMAYSLSEYGVVYPYPIADGVNSCKGCVFLVGHGDCNRPRMMSCAIGEKGRRRYCVFKKTTNTGENK